MSRIGQLIELKALRQEIETLRDRMASVETRYDYILAKYIALNERVETLEAKRGPGRPKNERQSAGSN